MLAIASRSMVMRVRGSRRASAIKPAAMPRSSANTTIEDADEHAGDPLVVGEPDRDRDQQRDHGSHQHRDSASAAECHSLLDGFAKQRRHRHVMHPAERPQSERERGQQAIDEATAQFIGMQRRHHRQRQQLAEHADDDEGQRRADDQPDHRADRRRARTTCVR